MPIYEYMCNHCGHRFEKIQKVSDSPCKKCPHCGSALRKLISSSAIQFKGNGFYITDYAKKAEPSSETAAKPAGAAKEKPQKDTPPAAKTERPSPGKKSGD